MYEFVVPIRLTLIDQMAHVAREQGKSLVPLNHDLPLFDSGPDSLGVAVLVARLEGRLGVDPFKTSEEFMQIVSLRKN